MLEDALKVLSSDAEDWAAVTHAARDVADGLGRDEALRKELGATDLPAQVVSLLEKARTSSVDAQMHLFRVLGNLCVGGKERDETRQRLLDQGAATAIAQALGKVAHVSQLATGAALNLSMSFAPSHVVFVESGLYAQLLERLRPGVLHKTLNDAAKAQMVFSWTLQIIEEILTAKTPLPLALLQQTIAVLCSIILNATVPPLTDKSPHTDIDTLTVSAELLEALTLDDEAAPGAFVDKTGDPLQTLQELCTFVETSQPPAESSAKDAASFANAKAAVCKVITAAAADHAVMEAASSPATGGIVDRLIQWVTSPRERTDLLVTACISLANLARKDQFCVFLVHDKQLAIPLTQILQDRLDTKRQRGGEKAGESTQVLHGVLGLLKHLAVPVANKAILGTSNIIESAVGILDESFDVIQPVQHSAIGVLKHLCAGNPANATRVANDRCLPAVLALVARSDDFQMRSEATRIIGNAVRAVWAGQPGETGIKEAKERLSHQRVSAALANMARTAGRYVMLVNEAIIALALLASYGAGAARVLAALVREQDVPTPSSTVPAHVNGAIYEPSPVSTAPMPFSNHVVTRQKAPSRSGSVNLKPASAAAAVASLLSNTSSPIELRINACTLIKLAASQSEGRSQLSALCRNQLQDIAAMANVDDRLKRAAEGALQSLVRV